MKFFVLGILLCIFISSVCADRLPNQTPENQVLTIDTALDVVGIVDEGITQSWILASPGAIPTGILGYTQTMADSVSRDKLMNNGGKLNLNKNYRFDSEDMAQDLYNIESEKVLTYASIEGAHLTGEEEYTLSIAGNWANVHENIRCVFSGSAGVGVPAFCNIVSAKSRLINFNGAQISSIGQIRAVTNSISVPMALNYRIAVTPEKNSGSISAEGTVSTDIAGSYMEARNGNDYVDPTRLREPFYANTWNRTAAENTWKDSTTVIGGIRNFAKVYIDPSSVSGSPFEDSPVFNPPPNGQQGTFANTGSGQTPAINGNNTG
jgi:hypothetical protein